MPSDFHNRNPPPSRSAFPFFRQTLKGSLICPISVILRKIFLITLLLFLTMQLVIETYPDSESSGMKIFKKIQRFLLTAS